MGKSLVICRIPEYHPQILDNPAGTNPTMEEGERRR